MTPPMMSTSWRGLDPIDRSWSGVHFSRAVTGIEMPGTDRICDALADLATCAPELGRWTSELPPRWRPIGPGELPSWLEHAFVADDSAGAAGLDPHDVMHRTLDRPLVGTPLRVYAGPDWLGIRMSHSLGDGWTSNALLGQLLRQATSPDALLPRPWRVLSPRRRDAVIAKAVLRRLPTVGHALRHRAELAGGDYEPAGAAADALDDRTYTIGNASFPGRVRALRDELYPGSSVAALTMTGIRAALAESSLPAPRPGFECLFNTRSDSDGTANAWGNWSAGVYVRPARDLDPLAVTDEMRRVRRSGLPDLAHASLRARSRTSDASTITMPRAVGAPRLTMSYTNGHVLADAIPGLRAGESDFGTWTRPNGTESITVQAVECAGRLSAGLSFFPDVWPAEVVCCAVAGFLADPAPVLRSLPGQVVALR